MVIHESRCLKCGKPKSQAKQASITQWMSNCNCDLVVDEEVLASILVSTCQTCGKRVEQGRAGSMTQWVFRSDICSCEHPKPRGQVNPPPRDASSAGSERELAPEIEIEVDSESFPLERYKPLQLLGAGAAGSVYLCRDRLLNLKVAVKVLRYLNAEQLISFQQEARATSKLNHPNIIKVLNFGASEIGAPYMVMEFFSSSSLESLVIENGALPPDVVLYIVETLCEALASAHEQGIFHRDLKSSNILVSGFDTRTPDVRLIDFGVALVKQAHQEPTIVQGITVVGTPKYMPPDQALGRSYDARSEVYSLGCVLFEALSGRLPFIADTALELVGKHAHEEPPWLADANPDIQYSDGLESLVASCLAKDPDERFQSMTELKHACLRVAGGAQAEHIEPEQERGQEQNGPQQVPSEMVAKNRQTALILVGAMMAVVAGGFAFATSFVVPGASDGSAGKENYVGRVMLLQPSNLRLSGKDYANLKLKEHQPIPKSDLTEGIANVQFERDSRARVSYATDETLKSIPEGTVVKALSLYSSEFSKSALKSFLDRSSVTLGKLELGALHQSNLAISTICSHPKTKLSEFRISSSFDRITNGSVAALVRHPLKDVRILDTDFEVGAFGALLDALSIAGVREIELAGLPESVLREFDKSIGKISKLKVLSLNSCILSDRAYLELKKLRYLQQLFIEFELPLTAVQAASVASLPRLDCLSVGKSVLSPEQLRDVLANRRLKSLRLTKRPDLTSDLEFVKQAKIQELHICISDELKAKNVAQLASMKQLKRLRIESRADSPAIDRNNKFLINSLCKRVSYEVISVR